MGWLSGYDKRKSITIDQTKIDQAQVYLLPANCSADSIYGSGYEANKCVDCDSSTIWSSSQVAGTHWWNYDFGSGNTRVIKRWTILPVGDGTWGYGLKDFSIQGSNDNANWDTLYTAQHANNGNLGDYSFTNTTAYRYYRLLLPNTWRGSLNNNTIGEITMWEDLLENFPVLVHLHADLYTYGATNLCTGKTATADSENGSETAANAIDNNTGTFWTSALSGTPPRWLKIDLGSDGQKAAGKYVITIRSSDGSGKPTAWQLQGSNTGAFSGEETILDTQTAQTFSGDGPNTYTFNNTTSYRYYRLYVTATSGGVYVQIKEFALYEAILTPANFDFSKVMANLNDIRFTDSDGTTFLKYELDDILYAGSLYSADVLSGGTASGDTNGGAWATPANVVDNNDTTFGNSVDATGDHWWKYDLSAGISKTVTKVRIKPYNNGWGNSLKDFHIDGSNDNTNWTTLYIGQHANTNNYETYIFPNTTAYRYYRIYMTSTWMSGHTLMGLYEVEMMETTLPVPAVREAIFWVKIPVIPKGVDSVFYIYYKKSEDTDGSDRENVWDTYHKGIWHLSGAYQGNTNEVIDSTSNHNHGNASGTVTQIETPTKIGHSQDFNSSRIVVPDSASLEPASQDFTWSLKTTLDTPSGNRCFIGRETSGTSYFYFAFESSVIRFRDYTGSGSNMDFSSAWSPAQGVLYDIEVVRRGRSWIVYVNNVLLSSTALDPDGFLNRAEGWSFGGHSGIGYMLDGQMDEIRMSFGIARSDAWRKARINSDNDTLVTFGSEESHSSSEAFSGDETATLGDAISLKLSTQLPDSFNLSDDIHATQAAIIQQNDGINLSDTIGSNLGLHVTDAAALTDEIETDVSLERLIEDDAIDILDEIAIFNSGSSASFATKIIASGQLSIVTDTTPLKLVRVDISDPANPVWEMCAFPGLTHGKDAVYNPLFNYIYVPCASGMILQIDNSDFNNYSSINTQIPRDLLNICSLDASLKLYSGTNDTTGEIVYIDQAIVSLLSMNIQIIRQANALMDIDIRTLQGGIFGTNLQCLETRTHSLGLEIRVLADPFDEIALDPIKQSDFHVLVNGVELADIDLSSIEIYHAIGEKSTARFNLCRQHDALNTTVEGTPSEITQQNAVQIFIQDKLEFNGKVSRIKTDSENETVEVTAAGTEKENEQRTINMPLASLNEKLHPYHCLVDNEDIYNPYIDPTETNPEFYFGVQVDLGKAVSQNIAQYISFQNVEWLADEVISGNFQPKQNWTYFWYAKAKNYLTGIEQGTLSYVGTSPASLTSDIWEIKGMSYWYQRQFDDSETELGIYQLGSAPYKEVSTRNGKKIAKSKWVDQTDGLYREKDEGYDYTQYARDIAALELQKLKNINGAILPRTSCDIELMIDGYYFYGLKLLTRINIDNTTIAGIYKNNNGFPVAVKTIQISSSSMRVSLKCDNEKSDVELAEIDALYPNEDDPRYKFAAEYARIAPKFDYGRFEFVE